MISHRENAAAEATPPWVGRFIRTLTELPGPAVFTTSFGLEDQAIIHVIAEAKLKVTLATLDTGRLFPETLDLWAQTELRYDLRITAFTPESAQTERLVAEQGPFGFRFSTAARRECCRIRKVVPLERALAGHSVWITGLRAGQSQERRSVELTEYDSDLAITKLNPLFDQSRAEIAAFCRDRNIPVNVLHAKGFPSIGCAPCTRAVLPSEDERAGRWWWEQGSHSECGLHRRPGERRREAVTLSASETG